MESKNLAFQRSNQIPF